MVDITFDKPAKESPRRYRVQGKGKTKEEKEANLWFLFGYKITYDDKGSIKDFDYEGTDKAPFVLKDFSRIARPTIYVQVLDKKPEVGMQRNGTIIELTNEAAKAILEEFKAQFPDVLI